MLLVMAGIVLAFLTYTGSTGPVINAVFGGKADA